MTSEGPVREVPQAVAGAHDHLSGRPDRGR